MKYKDYFNFELGNRDIYSHNDILGMTVQDLFDQELPLSYQYNTIGIPKDDELKASPNTYQYRNANGKLRWRSSSKTTEELLEEERQRRLAQEAQTQMPQPQSGTITGGTVPNQSIPETEELPMLEDLSESDSFQNALSNLKDSFVDRINRGESFLPWNKNRKKPTDGNYEEPLNTDSMSPEDEQTQEIEKVEPVDSESLAENELDQEPNYLEENAPEDIAEDDPVFKDLAKEVRKIPGYKEYQKKQEQESSQDILKGNVTKHRLSKWINDFVQNGFNPEDDLSLRGEMQDRYDKFVNNKIDYSAKMTLKEKLTDSVIQGLFSIFYPAASDVYTDGMTDFMRARKNPNANVLENMKSLDNATQNALLEYGVKPNERGVYYNADSNISKKFAKSPEVKKFFNENEELIKQGKKTGENFNFDAGLKNLFWNRDKLDRYGSLQHAKMIGAYYDEKGNKHARFIDNVDYERRSPEKLKELPKTYMNNHGFNMQEKGNFENYYTVLDILLKETLKEKLKRKFGHK